MQIQDFFIKCSDWRPFKSKVLNKVIGNGSRIFIKPIASLVIPIIFKLSPGVRVYRKRTKLGKVSTAIISMTSFPARISYVWLVIECLLRQSIVPSKIIVYLSLEQFHNKKDLPQKLREYPNDIVEFRFVDGDIRSHKKYWYATKEWMGLPLVLVDDDIIYDSRMLEDLEYTSRKLEKTISCCWGVTISWDENGKLKPYSEWKGNRRKKIGERDDSRFFGSGGGTYFPIGSLKDAHQDISVIMANCPTADDIWLNAITRKNGYRAALIRNNISVPEWKIKNNQKLCSVNNGQQQNDKQLYAVRKYIIENYHIDPFCI